MRSICVFCGSNTGAGGTYAEAARGSPAPSSAAGSSWCTGAATSGSWASSPTRRSARGAHVIGVIPRRLVEKEVAHSRLTEQRIVEAMHERKALMAELSDAFIALPGGLGTLDETFEMLTWTQLGYHRKPLRIARRERLFRAACRVSRPRRRTALRHRGASGDADRRKRP